MKKLMLSTAIVGATAVAALAQEATTEGMFRMQAEPTEIRASDFIGMRVYASEAGVEGEEIAGVQDDWEDIGEINDVILTREGEVEAVLVDIGGFLGIGEQQVAVDMDAVQFVADSATAEDAGDFFLVMNAARTDFENAPPYGMETDAAGGADTAMTTDSAVGDTATGAEGGAVMAPEGGDTAATTEGDATTTMDGTGTDMATGTDADAMADDPSESLAGTTGADMETRTPMEREGFAPADTATLTADTLTGTRVYDANDEWVGDIDRLLLTDDGQITDVVVDVGGFLGIGAKPVALSMDELDVLQQSEGEEVRVYVPMTREELEALPEVEDAG